MVSLTEIANAEAQRFARALLSDVTYVTSLSSSPLLLRGIRARHRFSCLDIRPTLCQGHAE